MEIVDRVEVHVFSVPREASFPHSEVEVGRVHAVDLHVVVLVHPVQDGAELLDVPVLENKFKNASSGRSLILKSQPLPIFETESISEPGHKKMILSPKRES